jgi:hypothetical protein
MAERPALDPLVVAQHVVTKADAMRLAIIVTAFYQRLLKGELYEEYAHEHTTALLDALLAPAPACCRCEHGMDE